jgi:hypothetical protein
VFDEMSARAWTSTTRASVHNLVVDTYAMQHPVEFCRSAKSYVAHLTGLCFAMEPRDGASDYWAIPRWLNKGARLERPPDLRFRGTLTIADVRDLEGEAFSAGVRRWAADVWSAYGAQHALARHWLAAALS